MPINKFFSIILTIIFLCSFGSPVSAGYVSSSQEFNNVVKIVETFNNIYGQVDYSIFNDGDFNINFENQCGKDIAWHNCNSLSRTVAAAAVDHAFLYRINGDINDLNKSTFLLGKLVELYGVWGSSPDLDPWSIHMNSPAARKMGLAAWLIWDELDNNLKNSIKDVIVKEANFYLRQDPLSHFTTLSWGIDTLAEQNGAPVGILTMAAYFFSDEQNASLWEEHARCLAYHAITTAADEPYCGTKTITVFDNGDSIGVFRKTSPKSLFALDYDGDQIWTRDYLDLDGDGDTNEIGFVRIPSSSGYALDDTEKGYYFGLPTDLPVAGDWNGDGLSEIGLYRPSDNIFYLDNGDGAWQSSIDIASSPFGTTGDMPVIGDWNSDGTDDIGIFRIGGDGRGSFSLDFNGNRKWDGSVIDKMAYFGQLGDIPVAGKWNNSSRSYMGVYRPSEKKFYLDWDGDFQWSSINDKSYYFNIPATSANLLPIVGDWSDRGTDTVGLYDSDNAIFYLDYNNDFNWDNLNDEINLPFKFGMQGDKPLAGKWQKREKYWMANHFIRPHPVYSALISQQFLDPYLIYKKAGKNLPSQYFHNIPEIWGKIKNEYLNIENFSWTIWEDWGTTGLTAVPKSATFMCTALNTDCDLEKRMLDYKANNSSVNWFIEKPVYGNEIPTEFIYKVGVDVRSRSNYIMTERFIGSALAHDNSLLPSLPLRIISSDTTFPTIPTNLAAAVISSSKINLSWATSTDNVGVTGYRIYRNGTRIGTSASNSYSDTGLSPSTNYTYTVSAYDAAGNESAQSSPVTAATQDRSYNLSDFENLTKDWLKTLQGSPADVNADGTVNSRDLGIMMSNWQ